MPRGLPDYGIPIYGLASQYVDMATLFLAQTGFTSVDGTGRIFYADNFHGGVSGFERNKTGDAERPYPTTEYCYVPPLSLGLNPGTINGGGQAWVRKWLAIPDTEKIGLEVIVAAGNDHAVQYNIMLEYAYADGSGSMWNVFYRTDNGQIQIYSGGVYVNIDTYYINATGWIYTPIKLVGNIRLNKWDRLLVGNKGFNLSSYNPRSLYMPVKGLTMVQLNCNPVYTATSGDFGRYGYMILTIDEP
jgi:hypothetical protein